MKVAPAPTTLATATSLLDQLQLLWVPYGFLGHCQLQGALLDAAFQRLVFEPEVIPRHLLLDEVGSGLNCRCRARRAERATVSVSVSIGGSSTRTLQSRVASCRAQPKGSRLGGVLLDLEKKVGEVDGLRAVIRAAGRECLLLVSGHGVRRERDDG